MRTRRCGWRRLARAAFATSWALAGMGLALAGQLDFRVADASLSKSQIQTGEAMVLRYTLDGPGMAIPGALRQVTLDLLRGGAVAKSITLMPGDAGTNTGANVVSLTPPDFPGPGRYTIRVTASGVALTAPDFVEVSTPEDPDLQVSAPRGVDVNRVPGSPAYGRIYFTEGAGGATANRTTIDGVYALNSDLSPAFPGPRATSAELGALGPWGGSPNSPYRVVVAPDGAVCITDASDPHSGLFVADADLASVRSLFAYPAPAGGSRSGAGLVTDRGGQGLYGSTSSVWIEGSGSFRNVFTTDEDLSPGNSLWRREVPAGTTDLAAVPAFVTHASGADWNQDVVRDASGNSYLVSLTTDDAVKLSAGGGAATRLPPNGVGYYGVCLDEARDRLYLATNDGRIFQTDTAFTNSAAVIVNLGAEVRDVATDGEGWLYAADATDRRLRVFASAGDYVVADGSAVTAEALDVVIPLPGDVSPTGPSGLFVGPNGGRYGDGLLNLADVAAIARIAYGLDAEP